MNEHNPDVWGHYLLSIQRYPVVQVVYACFYEFVLAILCRGFCILQVAHGTLSIACLT